MSEYEIKTHFIGLGMTLRSVHRYATLEEAQAYIDDIIANGDGIDDDSKHAEYGKHNACDDYVHEIIEYTASN